VIDCCLNGNAPSHFEIAGADKVFHPATAVIEGNELIVSSDAVPEPKAVRYAFASAVVPNLMNKEGLPASSFRTDRWQAARCLKAASLRDDPKVDLVFLEYDLAVHKRFHDQV
jgi:hypothetical protein